jgi:GT2 family glycosyltransferase
MQNSYRGEQKIGRRGRSRSSKEIAYSMNEPIPIFIVHWNRPEQCHRAVESFLQQDYTCKVVVIDNASKPKLVESLVNSLSSVDRVSFIFNEYNLGFAGALAPVLGEWVKSSKAPICITAAHDVHAEPGAVRALVDTLLSEPNVGVAFALRNPPEEGLWNPIKGSRIRPLPNSKFRSGKHIYGTFFPSPCIAIKREILEKGAGVDARLFAYCEEDDLSLSAREQGYHSVLVTNALVENTEPGGSVQGSFLVAYLMARNSVLLADKYSGKIAAILRVIYVIMASFKNWLAGSGRTPAFSSRARIRGAIDALGGRYGPPPKDLMK